MNPPPPSTTVSIPHPTATMTAWRLTTCCATRSNILLHNIGSLIPSTRSCPSCPSFLCRQVRIWTLRRSTYLLVIICDYIRLFIISSPACSAAKWFWQYKYLSLCCQSVRDLYLYDSCIAMELKEFCCWVRACDFAWPILNRLWSSQALFYLVLTQSYTKNKIDDLEQQFDPDRHILPQLSPYLWIILSWPGCSCTWLIGLFDGLYHTTYKQYNGDPYSCVEASTLSMSTQLINVKPFGQPYQFPPPAENSDDTYVLLVNRVQSSNYNPAVDWSRHLAPNVPLDRSSHDKFVPTLQLAGPYLWHIPQGARPPF